MGKRLEWPIGEDMIGKKVRFVGDLGEYTYWEFVKGETYIIGRDVVGDIGPFDKGGEACCDYHNFEFELVDEDENVEPDGPTTFVHRFFDFELDVEGEEVPLNKLTESDHQLLNAWRYSVQQLDTLYDKYRNLLELESDLIQAQMEMKDAYTQAVAEAIQIDPDWLYFIWLECKWGETPRQVWVGKDEYTVDSWEMFITVLEVDENE